VPSEVAVSEFFSFTPLSLVILFRPMPDPNPPQFNTAEYPEPAAADHCDYCQQTIGARYYRVNNRMACPACTEKAALAVPQERHAAFGRALLFGAGAAAAGLVLYAAVEIATGWMIGYVSLAVGWMVAKAMMAGSKGIGGRRYQIAAILLTYAAVSMAIIPVILSQVFHSGSPSISFAALGQLAFIGLASPFLGLQNGIHGLIGLFILSIGIRIAWRMTAGTPPSGIIGPFRSSPPVST
jgi:hypothetical protein